MAFQTNANVVIDNYSMMIPVQYSTRSLLPGGSGTAV